MTDSDDDERRPPPHPADLPCIDPGCNWGRAHVVLCQRCAARIERARRAHRLRYQNRPLPGMTPDQPHEGHP